MKDFEQHIKDIKLPKFKNKALYKNLEKKLINKFHEKESRKIFTRPLFIKMAFSFIFIFSAVAIFFIAGNFLNKDLKFRSTKISGFVYLKKQDNDLYTKSFTVDNLKNNYSVKTEENSFASFILGSGYSVELFNSSELKVIEASLKNNNEECQIYLKKGKADFAIKKPTVDSIFQVKTDNLKFSVKGTEFSVEVDGNSNVKLDVKEGVVSAWNIFRNEIDLNSIKVIDKDIFIELSNLINEEVLIGKDESAEFKSAEFKSAEFKSADLKILNEELDREVIQKLTASKKLNETGKINILGSINELKDKKKNLTRSTSLSDKLIYRISNTGIKIKAKLNEKDTFITSDSRCIYISSDSNAAVYCVDVVRGNLKWVFRDSDLKTVTSPAIPYKDEIVLGSPNYIFILGRNGEIKVKKEIKNGPYSWTAPVINNDMVYIPGSKSIFTYDGKIIKELENLSDLNGPLFISVSSGILIINDLNNKKLKAYDLNKNKIVWESEVLRQRSFSKPEVFNGFIYSIDSSGTIYRFGDDLKNTVSEKLDLKNGVKSNLIFAGNNLIFIADDGIFYKINVNKFKDFKRVEKADDNKASDKYLTKRILKSGNEIFFCGSGGDIFYYNSDDEYSGFIKKGENDLLVGSPVLINGKIYAAGQSGSIYKTEKTK